MTDTQTTEVETALETLRERWRRLQESPEAPRSTMDIIEYGLGKQQRAELYVNRLLCYLLDPEASHGMDAAFLAAFLDGLPTDTRFDEDTYDLSDVRVNEQVTVESSDLPDDSHGYADLVIDVPNEWVLLVELKFSAAETGTEFYSDASHIGGNRVSEYESGRYYVYLHQRDEPEASSNSFVNWTWQSFVAGVLDPILAEFTLRYPQRTATQLHDLKTDIRSITNMDEQHAIDQQKVALYLEHVDAIEDVSQAFDDAWESYSHDWGAQLALALDARDDVNHQSGESFSEVTVDRADATDERWIFRSNGGDWQHLFKYGWYRHEDHQAKLTDRAKGDDLRIGFYHRMERHRAAAVRDHELKLNFRNMGSNPSEFIDIYTDKFDARRETIEEHLAETNGVLTGNKLTLIEATYDIPVDSHDGFFDAYTAALETAFLDLVVDHPELSRTLEAAFEEGLEDYQ
ncbi:PD-(D/E)XK nuclease family protein [Halosimplex pelagicum]|uniref:PD-(D/E)XK nuclease family protein n=1 Tax=Halosimplex pelagicum TaxID=869886 RepID=A0A7D5TEJ8_9EURY|nr:PD-(D/E)XK nuclease family protein [Halosimplex pelagicum]QLH84813.1 PD-(D/E)XK nuclease family protein [Halosimplex pelagicum]